MYGEAARESTSLIRVSGPGSGAIECRHIAPMDRVRIRKQSHPRRSLKQLASLAEKILNGIIVIEPYAPWEASRSSAAAPTGGADDQAALMAAATMAMAAMGRHPSGAPSPPMAPNEIGRTGALFLAIDRETMRHRPPSGRRRSRSTSGGESSDGGGGGVRLSASRSPAPMGIALPADSAEPGASQRAAHIARLVEARRRATAGGSSKGGMPLDIAQAPGASLLDTSEFALCATLRLYPLQYFQSRQTLTRNYDQRGFYKKSAAQKMLRIDVNKTGKLYDYFVSRSWMPAGPDARSVAAVEALADDAAWYEIIPL